MASSNQLTDTVSVIIPHYWAARQRNLLPLINALNHATHQPAEILIWNNGDPMPIVPNNVRVIQSPFNIGPKARLLAAMCASSNYVLFQDNDLMVHPMTVERLIDAHKKLGGVVALEGRKIVKGKPYDACEFLDGKTCTVPMRVHISIGRCELMLKHQVNNVLSDFPFDATTTMDDIWFSHVCEKAGYPRWCVPYFIGTGFTNLSEAGVGAYLSKTHMAERDALCRRLFPLERLP